MIFESTSVNYDFIEKQAEEDSNTETEATENLEEPKLDNNPNFVSFLEESCDLFNDENTDCTFNEASEADLNESDEMVVMNGQRYIDRIRSS